MKRVCVFPQALPIMPLEANHDSAGRSAAPKGDTTND